jgi:hypothetical protein
VRRRGRGRDHRPSYPKYTCERQGQGLHGERKER